MELRWNFGGNDAWLLLPWPVGPIWAWETATRTTDTYEMAPMANPSMACSSPTSLWLSKPPFGSYESTMIPRGGIIDVTDDYSR